MTVQAPEFEKIKALIDPLEFEAVKDDLIRLIAERDEARRLEAKARDYFLLEQKNRERAGAERDRLKAQNEQMRRDLLTAECDALDGNVEWHKHIRAKYVAICAVLAGTPENIDGVILEIRRRIYSPGGAVLEEERRGSARYPRCSSHPSGGSMSKKQSKAIAKVDAREASFSEWFVAQYGPCQLTAAGRQEYERVLADAQRVVMEYADALDRQAQWNACRDAALKAWSAARTQKP